MDVAKVRIAGVVQDSVTDGPGLRFVVFAQGCRHKCTGCHNPDTWSTDGGTDWTVDYLLELFDKNPLTSGITLSGGEPFLQAPALFSFVKAVRKREIISGRKIEIAIYTGFLFEDLVSLSAPSEYHLLLELCDVLIDGRFDIEKKSLDLKFRGSHNQRIIDIKTSLASNMLVLMQDKRWV
ncbi:MAG: anaerobic ribonucleoside-triphosphate reductase activating protein [Firmicutes bacterium]|nr:anaerobic ribonucleoside-triphosphate reductase activating protein [Bacillota bacterium]